MKQKLLDTTVWVEKQEKIFDLPDTIQANYSAKSQIFKEKKNKKKKKFDASKLFTKEAKV